MGYKYVYFAVTKMYSGKSTKNIVFSENASREKNVTQDRFINNKQNKNI